MLRYIIRKFCPEIHHTLLGHQYNCLSAPAEVSTWTKFCEIDLPRAIEREKQATAEGSGDVESSNEIPYELAQFEIHLRQPVKIHNIRKRMQLEQQASSSENGKRYFYYYKRIFFTPFLKTISVIDLFLQNYVPILYG